MMKKRICRLVGGLLALLLLLPTVPTHVVAEEAFVVDYTFMGDEKNLAGFGEGLITITPPNGRRTDGYYLLYYASDSEILKHYDEVASIPITGHTVTYHIKDSAFIPQKATRIAVFESDTPFVADAPAAETAVAFISIPAEKRISLGTAETTFGAIADVHMNYEAYDRGAYQKWKEALTFFIEKSADFVIVAGDMTGDASDAPLASQYQQYNKIIKSSKYPKKNIYEAIGNHGNTTDGRKLFVKYTSGEGEDHPFEGSAWYSVLKKKSSTTARDNLFIFMAQELEAPGDSSAHDNFSKEQIDWVEELLTRYENTNTNVFIILHAPFVGYGPGDRENGDYTSSLLLRDDYVQTMRLKALLESHKNVILMSGHTHLSLYDRENFSDENNTSCRMIHLGSGCQPTSYGTGLNLVRSTDGRHDVTPTYGSEAYTVSVYSKYIVYVGRNLSTGKIIPGACFILPIQAAEPSVPEATDLYSSLKGSGTEKDPYLIQNAADFKAFTDAFNTGAAKEDEMFGNQQYFLQTADIDMRSIAGYHGTVSSSTKPYFFAGTYNGNGHSLTVNIQGKGERSVFPVVYGTVCNVNFKGSIVSDTTVQPIHTVYGNVINCLIDMTLTADTAATGIAYVNYGTMYNIFAHGTLTAEKCSPVAAADSSNTYVNVFHDYRDAGGAAISDTYGIHSGDVEEIRDAFNNRDSIQHQEAQALIGENEMNDLIVENGVAGFESGGTIVPTPPTVAAAAPPAATTPYSTWVALLLGGTLVMTVMALIVWKQFSKRY